MLYPQQHSPVLQRVGASVFLLTKSPILQARACARWLISSEDALPPFLLLSLALFSSSSCLRQVHFIYHSFWTVPPAEFLLQPCPGVLYAIQAAHRESSPGSAPQAQRKSGDPVEELFTAEDATWRSPGLDLRMNACPSVWRSHSLVKHLHGPPFNNNLGVFLSLGKCSSGKEFREYKIQKTGPSKDLFFLNNKCSVV